MNSENEKTNGGIKITKRNEKKNIKNNPENENTIINQKNIIKKEKKNKISYKYLKISILLYIYIILIIFGFIYFNFKLKKRKNKKIEKIFCDSGFYFPEDDETNKNCKKCSVENCEKCVGNKYMNFCTQCKSGFQPIYENDLVIQYCKNINVNEQCLEFDENNNNCKICNNGYFLSFYSEMKKKCQICSIANCKQCFGSILSNICLKCINGYYIPDDDTTKQNCKKCSLNHCEKCIGTNSFDICLSCQAGFTPTYENGIIISCDNGNICITGENEKCKTCDEAIGQCSSCNDGYYLPTDDINKKECKKCSDAHCMICEGTLSSNVCIQCENLYELQDGICKPIKPNLIEAIYFIDENVDPDGCIKFINLNEDLEIIEQSIDNQIIDETTDSECLSFGDHKITFNLNIDDCSSLSYMFSEIKNLISISFKYFNSENIEDMSFMFNYCESLTSIDLSNFDAQSVTDMGNMFNKCTSLICLNLSNFKAESVINMESMFSDCFCLVSIDLSSFNTESVTNMVSMFSNCESLTSFDFSSLNTENLQNTGWMFYGCSNLRSIDFTNFNAQKIINMNFMFYKCNSLTSIDLSNVHTQCLNSSKGMFDECSSLSYIDISNFLSSTVKDIESMFDKCSSLTSIDFSTFTTTNLINAKNLLDGCTSLSFIDISTFHRLYNDIIELPMENTGTIKVNNNDWEEYIKTKLPRMTVQVVN